MTNEYRKFKYHLVYLSVFVIEFVNIILPSIRNFLFTGKYVNKFEFRVGGPRDVFKKKGCVFGVILFLSQRQLVFFCRVFDFVS